MTDWKSLSEADQAYHGPMMQLAEKTAEVEQKLREDVAAGFSCRFTLFANDIDSLCLPAG